MFTGLVQTIGVLRSRRQQSEGMRFEINCDFTDGELKKGESIAVDGVCITVEDLNDRGFQFTASSETLSRSTLGDKKAGQKVHLERALRAGDRLGGHIVQGHVDGTGRVMQLVRRGSGVELTIEIPEDLRRYVVEKGSVAVQGVSLTVAGVESRLATFALIPETLKTTYLGQLKIGDVVNLEVDILAKYVESFTKGPDKEIRADKLRDWGFI